MHHLIYILVTLDSLWEAGRDSVLQPSNKIWGTVDGREYKKAALILRV